MEPYIQIIPENITVHLGAPDQPGRNVTVPFIDYVKNVASGEIYPTWPESALRANIYAITTFAINRLFTEWYPSRGYDFDITSDTAFDQSYAENREVFENISMITDEIFNDYVVRQESIVPYFTQFCNGTTSQCEGLSQWGTVELAEQGYLPIEILRYYYGDDIAIVENAPVGAVQPSYPGRPLRVGMAGNEVKIIQTELNRISRNFPAIPRNEPEDGLFTVETERAVEEFQRAFDLPVTGVVDKATWYSIRSKFVGVKNLAELMSEGITVEESNLPFTYELRRGNLGPTVGVLQYYLNVIGTFNNELPEIPINDIYGDNTENAVRQFQSFYGLPVTGVTDEDTWYKIIEVYDSVLAGLPEGYSGGKAKLYPGYFLSEGMSGQDVTELQTYLKLIGENLNAMPPVAVTGEFDEQTRVAVETFQRLFGLPINGVVGPLAWFYIGRQYDYLTGSA